MFQRCVETTLELSEHLHREKKKGSTHKVLGENGWSATGGSNMKVGVLNLHHGRTAALDSLSIYSPKTNSIHLWNMYIRPTFG